MKRKDVQSNNNRKHHRKWLKCHQHPNWSSKLIFAGAVQYLRDVETLSLGCFSRSFQHFLSAQDIAWDYFITRWGAMLLCSDDGSSVWAFSSHLVGTDPTRRRNLQSTWWYHPLQHPGFQSPPNRSGFPEVVDSGWQVDSTYRQRWTKLLGGWTNMQMSSWEWFLPIFGVTTLSHILSKTDVVDMLVERDKGLWMFFSLKNIQGYKSDSKCSMEY